MYSLHKHGWVNMYYNTFDETSANCQEFFIYVFVSTFLLYIYKSYTKSVNFMSIQMTFFQEWIFAVSLPNKCQPHIS